MAGSRDGESADSTSMGGSAASTFGAGSNIGSASSEQQYSSSDGSVRIGSVDGSNQLLVRARPSQWEEIKSAIAKLDNVPLQVQIETRILEVTLTGQFQFGVQWYLEGLTGSTTNPDGSVTPGQPYRHRQIALGQGGTTYNTGDALFYSFINSKMQVALQALETSGNTKTLSAPSMVVLNNQKAHIQVGNQVPVNQTSIIGGLGTGGNNTTASQVTYLPTGVILDVLPRVNPGGLVYLNVHQQVSSTLGPPNTQGNYTIAQRDVATQIAVQSGQTVLLGGLIQQDEGNTNTGIPGLNEIPWLGRLFGTTNRSRSRTELIVLITPRVIRGGEDAKRITDEYQNQFESLAPLRRTAAAALPASTMGLAARPAARLSQPAAAVSPEQLQQQAVAALEQTDYVAAQTIALHSWREGTHQGSLCAQNWQVIAEARTHLQDVAGAATARKQAMRCVAPVKR